MFFLSRDPIAKRRRILFVRIREMGFWTERAHLDLDREWTAAGRPISIGDPWPDAEAPVRFAFDGAEAPADWPLDETRLVLDLGGEALLTITDGDGETRQFGLDPNHRRFALRTRALSLVADVQPRLEYAVPNRDARLAAARFSWVDVELEAFVARLQSVYDAVGELEGHEVCDPLLTATERAIAGLDWPSATDDYLGRVQYGPEMMEVWEKPPGLPAHPPGLTDDQRARVRAATERLDGALAELRGRYPKVGAVALNGHSHIDLAWRWPVEETVRKIRRTASTVADLCDEGGAFRFNQSSAWFYETLEREDPALFERVLGHVRAGRWETIGGMWLEPDTNMPTGESLVRQLLYGQRYFRERFGTTSDVGWVPDSFGFSPALPQVLAQAGLTRFLTVKPTWNETNAFPYDLFWWEGLDGTRVLCHLFENMEGTYNGTPSPQAALEVWQKYKGKHVHPETLYTVGWGDGGGGPTREMLTQLETSNRLPVLPTFRFTAVEPFFDDLEASLRAEGDQAPVWVGEWYFELHRGTYTTQGRTKRLHRRAEHALVAAESLGALAHLAGGPFPPSLEAAWKRVLFAQFHDVLAGASIAEVYERTEAELAQSIADAEAAASDALAAIAEAATTPGDDGALLVANPTLSDRPARLVLAAPCAGSQAVEGGYVFASAETVPALGARVLRPAPDTGGAGGVEATERGLENDALRVELAGDGSVASVVDKRADREVLAGPGNQLWAYTDRPRVWDAWDVDEDYRDYGERLPPPESVEVVERGPHRAAVRLATRYRHSTVVQDVRLWAGSARLEFHTRVEWHDRRVFLRTLFPLAVHTSEALFETAFGVYARATHHNTTFEQARFEVPAHRFALLAETGYGAALMNDGRYGYSADGGTLGLSLLRSPHFPDPRADEGQHEFTYALYPFEGAWHQAGVLEEAADLNRPLDARPVAATPGVWDPVEPTGRPLALGAFKGAEDGNGLVLRAYEPYGARGEAHLCVPDGWTWAAGLDGLEDETGDPDFAVRPFGVHAWKLRGA